MTDPLATWRDGPTKEAVVRYVELACLDGSPGFVPVADRVAVFDNDGTLWCEKPMPIQLDFFLRRLVAMAHDVVYVSGGRRGLDLGLSPADLVRVTGATVAPIGRPTG